MLFIRQIPRYVGDALSILRALAVIPFNFTLVAEAWTSAFLILGFAWATDLLDGVAVRKWGGLSDRYPNLDLDGISDTVLPRCSLMSLTAMRMRLPSAPINSSASAVDCFTMP